jgi:hypothetical protein
MEDADVREAAATARATKAPIVPGNPIRLRCSSGTTIFRTARRRTSESGATSALGPGGHERSG